MAQVTSIATWQLHGHWFHPQLGFTVYIELHSSPHTWLGFLKILQIPLFSETKHASRWTETPHVCKWVYDWLHGVLRWIGISFRMYKPHDQVCRRRHCCGANQRCHIVQRGQQAGSQNNNMSRYCHSVTSESLNVGRLMDKPHQCTGQESLAACAPLLMAGEAAPHFPHPWNLLHWHHGQHPNQLHDQLVD